MGRRRQRTRIKKPTLLVLCEDECAPTDYLKKSFGSKRGDNVTIVFKGRGLGPAELLSEAKKALNPTSRTHGHNNDFVFLVFDRDQHEKFQQTVQNIIQCDKIAAFITSPCFEYFWELHYAYTTKVNRSKDQEEIIKKYEGFDEYNKLIGSVPIIGLNERQETAISNCVKARKSYRQNNSHTPFSDMDLFIEYIEAAKANGLAALNDIKTDPRFYCP